MHNKKGFTLVEVLAAVILLGVIATLVTMSIIRVLNNSKKEAFAIEAQNIVEASANYLTIEDLSITCIFHNYNNKFNLTGYIKNNEDVKGIIVKKDLDYFVTLTNGKYTLIDQDVNQKNYEILDATPNDINAKIQEYIDSGYCDETEYVGDKNINIVVNNGISAQHNVTYDGLTKTILLTPNSGYNIENASLICTEGIKARINGTNLLITSASQNGTCTINMSDGKKVTLTLLNASFASGEPSSKPIGDGTVTFSVVPENANVSNNNGATINCNPQVTTSLSNGVITVRDLSEPTACTVKLHPVIKSFPYSSGVINSVKNIDVSGKYKLEVWGAQGGYRSNSAMGGKGGYSVGIVNLSEGDILYINTGVEGRTGTYSNSIYHTSASNGGGYRYAYYGGGDASDIRINSTSLFARVIVAGGGGSDGATNKFGGAGGGISGGTTQESCSYGGNTIFGQGGNMSYSGLGTSNTRSTQANVNLHSNLDLTNTYGGFGFGGAGVYKDAGYGGAGGGGWYGGAGTIPDGSVDDDRGGGGGSGWVYTAANYSTWCSQNPTDCNQYLLTSQYYLEAAETISGTETFTATNGTSTETGHAGSGYAKITFIE